MRFRVLSKVWLGRYDISVRHFLWMHLTLIGQQNMNGAALESWRFVVDYDLRCQFINYYNILYLFQSTVYLMDIGPTLITIHELLKDKYPDTIDWARYKQWRSVFISSYLSFNSNNLFYLIFNGDRLLYMSFPIPVK